MSSKNDFEKLLELIATGEDQVAFVSTCLQKSRNFWDLFVDYVKVWNNG